MTSVLRRRPVLMVAALTAFGAVLTGCDSGPAQSSSAVIVGDHTVSIDDVQTKLDALLSSEPTARMLASQHKLDLVSRQLVAELANHVLVAEAAKREGINPDAQRVAAIAGQDTRTPITTDQANGADPSQLAQELAKRARSATDVATDQSLEEQLASKYIGRLSVTYNMITVPDMDKARALAAKIVAQPNQSEQLIKGAATGGAQADIGHKSGANSTDPILFAAPVNTVFIVPATDQQTGAVGGFEVVHLTGKQTAASPPPDFQAGSFDATQLPRIGQFLTRPLAMELGVRVNPRYGVWNEVLLTVSSELEASTQPQLVAAKS